MPSHPHLHPRLQGDRRRALVAAVARVERLLRLASLANFVAFLLTGRYCSLAERVAGLRMVSATDSSPPPLHTQRRFESVFAPIH